MASVVEVFLSFNAFFIVHTELATSSVVVVIITTIKSSGAIKSYGLSSFRIVKLGNANALRSFFVAVRGKVIGFGGRPSI